MRHENKMAQYMPHPLTQLQSYLLAIVQMALLLRMSIAKHSLGQKFSKSENLDHL